MTLRTLTQLNNDFLIEKASAKREAKHKTIAFLKLRSVEVKNKSNRTAAIVLDTIFYLVVIMLIFTVLITNQKNLTKTGYQYFNVISESMSDEIPKGSLIGVKQTKELKTGDNITFMLDSDTSVTHKIIDIYESYGEDGARGFLTKGNNNRNPDRDIVNESNVVGKVMFVLPGAGAVLSKMSENIPVVLIFLVLCALVSLLFRGASIRLRKGVDHVEI